MGKRIECRINADGTLRDCKLMGGITLDEAMNQAYKSMKEQDDACYSELAAYKLYHDEVIKIFDDLRSSIKPAKTKPKK